MSDGQINRRSVLRATGTVAAGGAVLAGTAGAWDEECVCCVRLGKVEGQPQEGDVYEFQFDGETVTVEITETRTEDGEVVNAKVRADREMCRVVVKGGPGTKTREFSTGASVFYAPAPEHERNENRDRYAISYIEFYLYVRDETTCEEQDSDDDRRGRGRRGRR